MNGFRWRYVLPLIALVILGIILILDWIYDVSTKLLPGFDISEAVLFALVAITFGYAISIDRMARHMRQQQFNAVAPVMEIDAHGSGRIAVHFRNIGAGPALNFRCWIEDDQFPQLRNMNTCISRRAVGIDKEFNLDYISTDISNYALDQGYLRAQYEDVFGQTYESCLMISENALPELKYGHAREKIVI